MWRVDDDGAALGEMLVGEDFAPLGGVDGRAMTHGEVLGGGVDGRATTHGEALGGGYGAPLGIIDRIVVRVTLGGVNVRSMIHGEALGDGSDV